MNVIVDAAWLMLHCDGSADDLVRLVRARFPGITDDEISAAAAEMKAMAVTRRDHLIAQIEAGQIPGRKDTVQ